jgi:hypothetical protein
LGVLVVAAKRGRVDGRGPNSANCRRGKRGRPRAQS